MEKPKYTPEDVIQQDGPNKGNISDVELARVGAEAEDKRRKEINEERQTFKGKINHSLNRLFKNTEAEEEYLRGSGNLAGEKAMEAELEERAKKDYELKAKIKKSHEEKYSRKITDKPLAREMAESEKEAREKYPYRPDEHKHKKAAEVVLDEHVMEDTERAAKINARDVIEKQRRL